MQGFSLVKKVANGYFFEVLPARLHFYGGWAMQGNPCYARLFFRAAHAAAHDGKPPGGGGVWRAEGLPNQSKGWGKAPALALCALCAPAAPLRISTQVPFSRRRKPGPMTYGAGRLSRKGAGTSSRFP